MRFILNQHHTLPAKDEALAATFIVLLPDGEKAEFPTGQTCLP